MSKKTTKRNDLKEISELLQTLLIHHETETTKLKEEIAKLNKRLEIVEETIIEVKPLIKFKKGDLVVVTNTWKNQKGIVGKVTKCNKTFVWFEDKHGTTYQKQIVNVKLINDEKRKSTENGDFRERS